MPSGSKLVISKRERTLLLNSNVTQNYDWFFNFLKENERITYDFVESLSDDKKLFIKNMLHHIIKTASSEWKRDTSTPPIDLGEDPANRVKCSLSGTLNRHVFYIVNRLNGNRLNVGRECVKHFDIKGDDGKSISCVKLSMG